MWPTNVVSIGTAYNSPNSGFTDIWSSVYIGPTNSNSGFSFENFNTYGANAPMLKPQWGMTAWIGDATYQIYRVYTRRLYHSDGIYSFSDRRLKTNISVWSESALDKLMRISAYRYDMDPSKFGKLPEGSSEILIEESKNKIGFIAQEIQKEFPELVSTSEGDENNYLAVNYTMMIPVLLEAIKEQQALFLELQAKVEALEAK